MFACAAFIKEIGRGKEGARALSTEDAQLLWSAILDGAVSDVELGAVLLAYRVKGETPAELAGMLRATDAHVVPMPATTRPVLVIPSYNGTRSLPNLTPLLAGLANKAGMHVLVHGITEDASMWGTERVTSFEVWQALSWPVAYDAASLAQAWGSHRPAFMPVDALCPALDRLLALRRVMGVRNSSHTLAKLIQPFPKNGLLLASYTHPEYAHALTHLFLLTGLRAHLSRGTEGEAVANARRPARIDRFDAGVAEMVFAPEDGGVHTDVNLPRRDVADTVHYTQEVLAGRVTAPDALSRQVALCRATLGGI
jgi:anthranilate phosphoribosyltransferase